MDIQIVKEHELGQGDSLLLVRRADGWAVVGWEQRNAQVQWKNCLAQGRTDSAINAVADWTSEGTARWRFRNILREVNDYGTSLSAALLTGGLNSNC